MYSFIHRISCLSLIFLVPIFCSAQSFELEKESFSSKNIAPGESHAYEIELSYQELLMVRFEQESSDIAIRVLDPGGELMEEFDGNNGDRGPELVIIDPQISGTYRLIVQPLEEQKKPGNYRVKMDRRLNKGNGTGEVLGQLIQYWADQGYLPGFATVVLNKDEVLFQKAYGYADLQGQKAYTLESIQNIGSVSKTLIGLALMHAVEEGKLKLEDEVNQYLPFEVINPYHPEKPIRIMQLANHTSSIGEMEAYERSYVLKEPFNYVKGEIGRGEFEEMEFYAQNPEKEMGEFLQEILSKNGKYYKRKNYLKSAPGERYSYSNAGATLAAFILERIYNMPYHELTRRLILEKLGMQDSDWSFDRVEENKLSDLHFMNQKVIPRYSLITYPDGGLLSNAQDLTSYLQALMKGYYGESDFLSQASFQEIMRPHLRLDQGPRKNRNYGIFWELWGNDMGHNGGDPGAVCFIRFNKESGIGRIILTNIIPRSPMAGKSFSTIWKYLAVYGEKLSP